MRFLKIKKVGAKKSCPVVHIHPTTPFSSCLRASKISQYRMADSNRGYVKQPNFKESSPTPAIPATHQSCTVQQPQKYIRNHFHQISPINLLPYRKLKNWKMHHKEKTMLHSIREGAPGQDGQLLATSQLNWSVSNSEVKQFGWKCKSNSSDWIAMKMRVM